MSTPIYFGGNGVRGGRIRRLNASTFKELVERYIYIPVSFPLTRQEFFALPTDKDRDERKDGPYLVCSSYPFDEGHREDDTATSFHMVVLDLDEGEFVKDFFESPETLGEHLFPYNFTAFTTAKHTKEKPRLKVLIDVHPSHPSLHRRFVKFFLQRLGLPDTFKGSRESKTLSLPQYRPLVFKGESPSAVIAARLDGIAARESDLPDEEDENNEEFFGRTYAFDREDGDDEIASLAYLPVAGLTVDDIREPLSKIDPDCEYKLWYETAAALRHQFVEEEDAREAFELFTDWSSAGVKFQGRRDCWTKWKSFRPVAKGRAPITIRSLFKAAMDAGWENIKIAKKIQQTVLEWLESCNDRDELMQEGAKCIAAMPFKNDVVSESLTVAWRKRIKAVCDEDIDKATLKKEVSKILKKEAAAKQEQHRSHLDGWLQPQVYLAVDDVFHDGSSGVALKPGAFDRKFEKELMPKDEMPANGKPIMAPSAYALNVMKIPRVDRKIYCPLNAGEDSIVEIDGHLFLNTYDRNTIPVEDPEHATRASELFIAHVTHLVGAEYLEGILDFIAVQVQFPGRKILWLPLIQSAEGVGKGLLGKVLARVLGVGNVKLVSPEVIRDRWNDWQIGAQVVILEEVHFPGERREAVMNSLKPFITDSIITINQRHVSARNERNYANAFAFTNYKDALHLKGPDRRWQVIFSPLQTKQHVLDLNATGHFERMEWLLTPDGAGGLRYWLKKRKIATDFPFNGPAPMTKFRAAVIEESKSPLQIQIEDLIEDAVDPLIGREVIHVGRLVELVARGRHSDATRVPHVLSTMGFEKYSSDRVSLDGSRGCLYTHAEAWKNGVPPMDFLKRRLADFEDEFLL